MDRLNNSSTSGKTLRGILLFALLALALFLRVYRSAVPFHSGDFASMPFMTSHFWGWNWIVAHIHGPVQPAVTAIWARLVVATGFTLNETMWRLPGALFGTALVGVTWLLMTRCGAGRWTALMAAGMTACLPSLTSDARYPWCYETIAACIGAAAVWLWLLQLDKPTTIRRWLAGGAIGLYLLSHLVVHGLPVVVVAATVMALGWRGAIRRLFSPSLLVPIAIAISITAYSWFGLHGGIFSRMGRHVGVGTLHVGGTSPELLWTLWTGHFGPLWTVICIIGVAFGMVRVVRGDRRGLPALWAVAFLGTLAVFLDLSRIGRTTTYQIQGTWAATLAACMFIEQIVTFAVARRVWLRPAIRAAAATCGLAIVASQAMGSYCNLFRNERLPQLTGTVDYGRAVPDPGYKAAGQFIRSRLDPNAVVLITHDIIGMELPCAVYYAGRDVISAEDLSPDEERQLIELVRNDIDVAVVETRYLPLFSRKHGFCVAARIHNDTGVVLTIVERINGSQIAEIACLDINVADANRAFDRENALSAVPTMIADHAATRELSHRAFETIRRQNASAPTLVENPKAELAIGGDR